MLSLALPFQKEMLRPCCKEALDSQALEMLRCCCREGRAGSPVWDPRQPFGILPRVSVAGGTMRLSGWAEKVGVAEEAHLLMEVRKDRVGWRCRKTYVKALEGKYSLSLY